MVSLIMQNQNRFQCINKSDISHMLVFQLFNQKATDVLITPINVTSFMKDQHHVILLTAGSAKTRKLKLWRMQKKYAAFCKEFHMFSKSIVIQRINSYNNTCERI